MGRAKNTLYYDYKNEILLHRQFCWLMCLWKDSPGLLSNDCPERLNKFPKLAKRALNPTINKSITIPQREELARFLGISVGDIHTLWYKVVSDSYLLRIIKESVSPKPHLTPLTGPLYRLYSILYLSRCVSKRTSNINKYQVLPDYATLAKLVEDVCPESAEALRKASKTGSAMHSRHYSAIEDMLGLPVNSLSCYLSKPLPFVTRTHNPYSLKEEEKRPIGRPKKPQNVNARLNDLIRQMSPRDNERLLAFAEDLIGEKH